MLVSADGYIEEPDNDINGPISVQPDREAAG